MTLTGLLWLLSISVAYVGISNYLGGEKKLFGNNISKTISEIKKLRKTA